MSNRQFDVFSLLCDLGILPIRNFRITAVVRFLNVQWTETITKHTAGKIALCG